MRLLLDTHLLLWSAGRSTGLSAAARRLIGDAGNHVFFSTASIWEVTIKYGLGRPNFRTDPRMLHHNLLSHRYSELPVTSEHAIAVAALPVLHKDPFDRLLIAQSIIEGITLLTVDRVIASYPAPVQQV